MPPRAAARSGRARAAAALGLALVAALGACAEPATSTGTPDSSPSATLPSSVSALAVTADVFRTRIDPSRGGIQLSVRNEADAPLALAGARLESPLLSADPERDDDVLIPAGAQRDLPLTLPAPVCPAELGELPADGEPVAPPRAVLLVPLADGTIAELQVPTTDRLGQWGEWYVSSCFARAVEARVALSLRVPETASPGTVAVGLVVEPRPGSGGLSAGGAAPALRLESVSGTVLLGALDGDGRPAESIRIDRVIAGEVEGAAPLIVPLAFRPNRCDAHAIADDKQGTLLRVSVSLDGRSGTVTIAADSAAKDRIYAKVTSACATG